MSTAVVPMAPPLDDDDTFAPSNGSSSALSKNNNVVDDDDDYNDDDNNESSTALVVPSENTALTTNDNQSNNQSEPTMTGIESIPLKKSLVIVNNFVINTVQFLNKFVSLTESKLSKIHQRTQQMEIVLALLEAKIRSVDYINPDYVSTTTGVPVDNGQSNIPAAVGSSAAPPAPGPPGPPGSSASAAVPAAPAPPSAPTPAPANLLKDDPRFKNYFKMMAMGVPKAALRPKMQMEGLDPDVLDMDPEGPAPAMDESEKQKFSTALAISNQQESDQSDNDQEFTDD